MHPHVKRVISPVLCSNSGGTNMGSTIRCVKLHIKHHCQHHCTQHTPAQQVAVLLPGLVPRLLRAPPTLVARVAAHTSSVAQRLLTLKTTFPGVCGWVYMVLLCDGYHITLLLQCCVAL